MGNLTGIAGGLAQLYLHPVVFTLESKDGKTYSSVFYQYFFLLEAWGHLHHPGVYKQPTSEILYKSLQHLGLLFMTLNTSWKRIYNF